MNNKNGESLGKQSLNKDLGRITQIQSGIKSSRGNVASISVSVLFIACAGLFSGFYIGEEPGALLIICAAMLGGYMALNIGANDVANNVGPAVGSGAMSLVLALVIAALFESGGALIAGGDVVSTIKKGIIDPKDVADSQLFVWAMMATLISSALWVNLATYIGAPVSTTHSVVGGVMGAGIAAAGFQAVNWMTMSKIAASWVISPLLGGLIAALFLAFIKINIIYREDKIAAARRWVPVLVSLMASVFSCYLIMKGLKKVWKPELPVLLLVGCVIFVVGIYVLRPWVKNMSKGMENRNQSLRKLFHLPLIFSAALLSFAHGANDVANAIGPLAAIIHVEQTGDIASKVGIPIWVMLIGAGGISLGLFLFGPKLIRMVGEQITRMNPMRAFCVALSAAITVIVASGLGLPVSSTHIAVGAVFGVGFFREYYTKHSKRRRNYVNKNQASQKNLTAAGVQESAQNPRKRILVRRSHFMTIIAAWLITVPAAGLLSAGIFYILCHLSS